jgi:hypothetical protein
MGAKSAKSKQVPAAIIPAIVADLRELLETEFKGNKTALGKAFGVQQGSASAWFSEKPGFSWETLDAIEARTKKDYANRRVEERARAEAAMKWRAFEVLRHDGRYDLAKAFDAVENQKHDLSSGDLTWRHYLEGAKTELDGKAPRVEPADIPLPPGPPPQKASSAGARKTLPPIVLETPASREVDKAGKKRARIRPR